MTVLEIVADVVRRLDESGIPYVIGGSLSSSTWGQMRQTNDADIAVRLSEATAETLLQAFPEPYYVSASEIIEALEDAGPFRTVQVLHMDEAFKIDLFLLGDGEYETSELKRARAVEIAPGTVVRFSSPENIVIAKLRWYELGNQVSDRQWNDIVQVLEIQAGKLDDTYLDRWAEHFGVRSLLDQGRTQAL